MTILRRYKILLTVGICIAIFFYFYNIWVMDRAISYMATEILKSAEHQQYFWNIKGVNYYEALSR